MDKMYAMWFLNVFFPLEAVDCFVRLIYKVHAKKNKACY